MSISARTFENAEPNSKDEPGRFAPGFNLPFVLVTALFRFRGIPSNMNDILIKQFMKSFEVTRFKAGLIQSAFYMGHLLGLLRGLDLPAYAGHEALGWELVSPSQTHAL